MNTVVTHNGNFHADDLFAVASLSLLYDGEVEVIRSRDPKVIGEADIVVDVGQVYDPKTNRFDHHQEEGAGERENGVPYASFGLVWKHFGEEIAGSKEAAEIIDEMIIQPVDAFDNGVELCEKPRFEGVSSVSLNGIVAAFRPTWKEDPQVRDEIFLELVEWAKVFLSREIKQVQDVIEAQEKVEEYYEAAEDKRVVVMEENIPWTPTLVSHPEPLFVVYPKREEDEWRVKVVPTELGTFEKRKSLPEAWAGKEGEELQKVTGVDTAVFCHRKLFLAVARTKEDALKMVQTALEE